MSKNEIELVLAFVQPFQLERVVDAVRALADSPGLSASEVVGFGSHGAHPPRPGDSGEVRPLSKKIRIEVVCRSRDTPAIVDAIRHAAHTGNAGDGKVFVSPVSLAWRIRTGEEGETALLARRRRSGGPPTD